MNEGSGNETGRKNLPFHKEYITEEWGEKVAEAFEQKTIDFLNLLSRFPEMGTIDVPEKQIRGFLLSKQTRVSTE